MKKAIKTTLYAIACLALLQCNAVAFGLNEIEFWVGSGNNSAVLVIDWNDGKAPVSLAWGYRWDGNRTGYEMLQAIAEADPRLYGIGSGGLVFGLGYDLDTDGFSLNPSTSFTNGWSSSVPNDARITTDMDDHFREGWMSAGYWSYWLKSDSSAVWNSSMVGAASRNLSNGVWDGWSFAPAPSWSGGAPDAPVPALVPEPSSIVVIASGLVAFMRIARRS